MGLFAEKKMGIMMNVFVCFFGEILGELQDFGLHKCISYREGSPRNRDLANIMFLPHMIHEFQSKDSREVMASENQNETFYNL